MCPHLIVHLLLHLLFISALSAFALPTPQTTRNSQVNKQDIVGGKPVSPQFKYPFIASLQRSSSHFCGGILVSATQLLTAAHCSDWSSLDSLSVHAHRFDLDKPDSVESGVVFKVATMLTSRCSQSTSIQTSTLQQ